MMLSSLYVTVHRPVPVRQFVFRPPRSDPTGVYGLFEDHFSNTVVTRHYRRWIHRSRIFQAVHIISSAQL